MFIMMGIYAVPSEAKEAETIADEVLGSVGLILAYDKNDELLQIGSGFVVDEGMIVTNVHVIERARTVRYRKNEEDKGLLIEGVVAIDIARDLVVLKVAGLDSKPLTLATDAKPAVGEHVYAAGNPLGMAGTFSDGIVSAIREVEDTTIIQVSSPISPGSSGGPIVNSEGQVIGVAVATVLDGQNLNLSISIRHVRELLNELHPVQPLEKIKQDGQEAVYGKIGAPVPTTVRAIGFLWDEKDENRLSARLSVSIQNKSKSPVQIWYAKLLVYDSEGELIYSETIDMRPRIAYEPMRRYRIGDREDLNGEDYNRWRQNKNYLEELPLLKRWISLDHDVSQYEIRMDLLKEYHLDPDTAKRYGYWVPISIPALNAPDSEVFPRKPVSSIELRILDFDFDAR